MDFTHAPYLIDGVFPAILNVVDLASHQQLRWLAVEHENAATVVDALADLFAGRYGVTGGRVSGRGEKKTDTQLRNGST